jgi:hypothetical protein
MPLDAQRTGKGRMTRRRLDVREAADVLGTTVDAVRKRIQRGTLEAEKEDGTVYVWLDTGQPESLLQGTEALVEELRANNATLREQLEAEREVHREARRSSAGLVQRIPELPPAASRGEDISPSGPPEGATDGAGPVQREEPTGPEQSLGRAQSGHGGASGGRSSRASWNSSMRLFRWESSVRANFVELGFQALV